MGKQRLSQRVLSLLLACVMLLTCAPAAFAESTEAAVMRLMKTEGTVSVSYGTLNLRNYPSSVGTVLANMPNGASVTIYGGLQGWYVVRYGEQMGYAAAAYISTP